MCFFRGGWEGRVFGCLLCGVEGADVLFEAGDFWLDWLGWFDSHVGQEGGWSLVRDSWD